MNDLGYSKCRWCNREVKSEISWATKTENGQWACDCGEILSGGSYPSQPSSQTGSKDEPAHQTPSQ